jgi:hypothetical protein
MLASDGARAEASVRAPTHDRCVQITPIAAADYARTVLPATFELWGAGRTYEAYVADFFSVANSRLVRRRKHTVGLYEAGMLATSCKLYGRELHWGERTMRAVGIGAVFTPAPLRGRGYAIAMLGALLDAEVAAGTDLAFLFSDIQPLFYERLGFARLPSRLVTVRATSLPGRPTGSVPLADADWPLVRRCFDELDAQRAWGFTRTPVVWEWIRAKWTPRPERGVQAVQLIVKRGRTAHAYVLGRRVVAANAFVVDEYGYSGDGGRETVTALLRAAAGDLARVSGWLPPLPARDALPRGSVRARPNAILMVAPLSSLARSWWRLHGPDIAAASADAVWSADHV